MNVTLGGGGMYRIAPNPVRDELTVSLLPGSTERASVLILRDIYGKPLMQVSNPEQEIRISVSHLQPGVYTLEWLSGKKRQTQKILIIR